MIKLQFYPQLNNLYYKRNMDDIFILKKWVQY